jgi:predicted O-methyltransferase YrrM
LQQRRFDDKNVLEFGGGQSTIWWSRHARSVLTIEADKHWLELLQPRLSANVVIHHVPVDQATRTTQPIKELIDRNSIRKFDVIIIDGHLRKELTTLAFNYLAPNGAIILDNSEGFGFYDETRDRNCRRIDFFGFTPSVSLRHCTSIVFVGDCFLLRPDIPIPVIELPRS